MSEPTATNPTPVPSLIQRFLPEGALSTKQKRWGGLGLIVLIGIVIFFAGTGKNEMPAPKQSASAQQLQGTVPLQRIKDSTEAMQHDLQRLKQARAQLMQAQNAQLAEQVPPVTNQNLPALQDARIQRTGFQQYGNPDPYREQAAQQAQQSHASPIGRIGFDAAKTSAPNPPQAQTEAVHRASAELKADRKAGNGLDFDPALPTCILPEGTLIETVLTDRLHGENSGPVNVMATTPVYCPGTQTLLIPQGARFIGQESAVSTFGQQRLAVSFHRLLIQKGAKVYSVPLGQAQLGLDQEGAAALAGHVNSHYASIFGSSLAVGAIAGLAQIGNGYSGFGYDPSVEFRNGITQSMAQSSNRILDRFLNRMPTITIPEGTRVKIMLTGDVPVPEFREE
jgi:type IV secretory pathway VirB10-like protein